MLYTVSEMARLLGVAASTLRYYDQEGLLPFVARSQGGIRMFTDEDYAPLMVIGCLKKSGLSIKEIRAFIALAGEGDASLAQRLELFRRRRDAVARQIAELQETLALLDYKCWYYEAACRAGTEDAVRHAPCSAVPDRCRAAAEQLRRRQAETPRKDPTR